MTLAVGDTVSVVPTVRRFGDRSGIVVVVNDDEGEVGVRFPSHGRGLVWFRECELEKRVHAPAGGLHSLPGASGVGKVPA